MDGFDAYFDRSSIILMKQYKDNKDNDDATEIIVIVIYPAITIANTTAIPIAIVIPFVIALCLFANNICFAMEPRYGPTRPSDSFGCHMQWDGFPMP